VILAVQRVMQALAPGARVVSLSTGHAPQFSAPERLAQRSFRFSRKARERKGSGRRLPHHRVSISASTLAMHCCRVRDRSASALVSCESSRTGHRPGVRRGLEFDVEGVRKVMPFSRIAHAHDFDGIGFDESLQIKLYAVKPRPDKPDRGAAITTTSG